MLKREIEDIEWELEDLGSNLAFVNYCLFMVILLIVTFLVVVTAYS